MTILHRRLLYISFSVIFLLVVPMLILLLNGYRLDVRNHHIYKTGLLVITTQPKAETVVFDGRMIGFRTNPFRITGVVPGEHQLEIRASGYVSWKKAVTVLSGQVTQVDAVQLFRDAAPEQLQTDAKKIVLAPNGRTVAILKTNSVLIAGLSDNSVTTYDLPAGAAPKDVVWSPLSTAAIITTDRETTYMVQDRQTNLTALPSLPDSIDTIVWDQRQPQTVYALSNKALFSYDILTNTSALLLSGIIDMQQRGDALLLLQRGSAGTVVAERSRDGAMQQLATLSSESFHFLPSPDINTTLLDSNAKTLVVLHHNGNRVQTTSYSDVQYATWSKDGTRLAYGNDIELSVQQQTSAGIQTQLISRTSGGQTAVWWLDPYPALLVQRGENIQLFDSTENGYGAFLPFLPLQATTIAFDIQDSIAVLLLTDGRVVTRHY